MSPTEDILPSGPYRSGGVDPWRPDPILGGSDKAMAELWIEDSKGFKGYLGKVQVDKYHRYWGIDPIKIAVSDLRQLVGQVGNSSADLYDRMGLKTQFARVLYSANPVFIAGPEDDDTKAWEAGRPDTLMPAMPKVKMHQIPEEFLGALVMMLGGESIDLEFEDMQVGLVFMQTHEISFVRIGDPTKFRIEVRKTR